MADKKKVCKDCEFYDESMMWCEVFEDEMTEESKACAEYIFKGEPENQRLTNK